MPYTAEISRANPSCFLFLIDQSGSMEDPIGGQENKRKAEAVADVINRILQGLIIKCAKGEGVRNYFEVGVIGYGLSVGSAYTGALTGRNLVPIGEVADTPAHVDERKKKVDDGAGGLIEQTIKFPIWFAPLANGGTPMCEAFRRAHQLLQEWIAQHQSSHPPIVINITDGESTDGDPTGPAQTLASLSTADGNVLVFNCHLSSRSDQPIIFADTEAGLPDEYARLLFKMSSVLPEKLRQAALEDDRQLGEQARGFVFNADLEALVSFLDLGTRVSNLR